MEERQNRQEQPRTYGDESPIYENQRGNSQNVHDSQPVDSQNIYGQQPESGQNVYGGQSGNYQNAYIQQSGNSQNTYGQQPGDSQRVNVQQSGNGQGVYGGQPGNSQGVYGGQPGNSQNVYGGQPVNSRNVYGQQVGNGSYVYGGQPGGPNVYGQQNYSGQMYGRQNLHYGQNPYQPPQHGPVTDVFCYILLVIMPLRIILGFFSIADTVSHISYQSLMNGSYMSAAAGTRNVLFTLLSYGLLIAFIVFVILDIVKINKQNYKITGLILFAIFLNPGYYIWRAHILGRKKTVPVIYTVAYALLLLAYMVYTFYLVFNMIMGIMYNFY